MEHEISLSSMVFGHFEDICVTRLFQRNFASQIESFCSENQNPAENLKQQLQDILNVSLFFRVSDASTGFSVPHGNASLVGNDTDIVDYETLSKQGTFHMNSS